MTNAGYGIAASISCALLGVLVAAGCYQQQIAPDPGDAGTDSDADTDSDVDADADSDSDSESDTNTGSEACATVDLVYDPINMLILLDRSRSMYTNTIETQTFAEAVAEALKDVVDQYNEGIINFGLAVFPSLACINEDEPSEHECDPASDDDNPVVEVGMYNFAEVDLALDVVGQCGGTPLCGSLEWALTYLTGPSFPDEWDELPKYVLLATDGEPNCNYEADIESCTCTADTCTTPEQCLDDLCTYNAALQLAAAGIPVFVIGVGTDLDEWDYVMDNIATYGGTGAYYPTDDIDSLADALDEVTGAVVSCSYGMSWSLVPDAVARGCDRVILEAHSGTEWVEIPRSPDCSDPMGWRWEGEPPAFDETTDYETHCIEIVLCEGTCQALQDGWYDDFRANVGHQGE